MSYRPIPRRTFLRGLGTLIALPALECMLPLRANAQAAVPQRLAMVYYPNGFIPENGARVPDYILNRVSAVSADLSIIHGLNQKPANDQQAEGPGGHGGTFSTFLTCQVAKSLGGGEFSIPRTFDQVIALERFAQAGVRFNSLSANPHPKSYKGDAAYNPLYSNVMSWKGPRDPAQWFSQPKLMFDAMFSNGVPNQTDQQQALRVARQKSILDFVKEDISGLNTKLSTADRQKIDQYLTGVREIERKLANIDTGAPSCDPNRRPTNSAAPYPPSKLYDSFGNPLDLRSEEYPQRLELTQDLLIKAFECDLTRVFSLMHASDATGLNHSWLPIEGIGDWHTNSHFSSQFAQEVPLDKKYRDFKRITEWHHDRFKDLVVKLKNNVGPSGTSLLDETLVVFCTSFSNGNNHSTYDLHALLAGKGGGKFKPGARIQYGSNFPLANLWLTILRGFGDTRASYGNSSGVIPSLLA